MVSDIRDVREATGRAIPYRLLLTKVSPLRSRVTDYAYQQMEHHGLPMFRTVLVERSAYKEVFLTGGSRQHDRKPGRGQGPRCRRYWPRSGASPKALTPPSGWQRHEDRAQTLHPDLGRH